MKQLLTALFCCIFTMFFSQKTYQFDYFISCEAKENTKNKKNEKKNVDEFLYDSKSKQELNFRVFNSEVTGQIVDIKDEISHVFDVDAKNSNPVFEYKYSSKFKNSKSTLNQKNVFEIKKIDSLNYKILVFQNQKRKNIDWEIEVALEEASFDWIHLEIHYNRRDELEQKLRSLLNKDKKYIIKKISLTDPYRFERTFEIKKIQNVDFTLQVPKEQILN